MAIIVEHEKRKCDILNNSLDLFVEEGYGAVTFQKIADRCKITRTTLYIYFKNKREIFLWSIKQLTQTVEKELSDIILQKELPPENRLKKMLDHILDICKKNQKLFSVILSYLLENNKTGKDISNRIKRRVVRLRHLLSTIMIEGINSGNFKTINVKTVNDLLYGVIESAIFRLATYQLEPYDDLYQVFSFTVAAITAHKSTPCHSVLL